MIRTNPKSFSLFVVGLSPDIIAKVSKSDRPLEKDDSDPSIIKVSKSCIIGILRDFVFCI